MSESLATMYGMGIDHLRIVGGTNAAIEEMQRFARSRLQADHAGVLWYDLTLLVTTPIDQVETRIDIAFTVLRRVLAGIEHLGAMEADYLRKLFTYGVQALRVLERTLARRFSIGGKVARSVDFVTMAKGFPSDKKSKSMKNRRGLRREVAMIELQNLFGLEPDDLRRCDQAYEAMRTCVGVAFSYKKHGALVKAPELCRSNDEKWEAEMWHFSVMALVGVARCLSKRLMMWEVEICGQVVPGTGWDGKEETFEDWRAVEEGNGGAMEV